MAIGIETPGQFSELIGILKNRRWQIILPVLFGVAFGIVIAIFVPKKYEITTTVEIRDRSVASDANNRSVKTPATSQEITNAENHIKHFKRIREVIESEGWDDYELLSASGKKDYIERVRDNLTVKVQSKRKDSGSTFMDITFLAADPKRGEVFLTQLAEIWVTKVVDRERKALSEEANGLNEQVKQEEKDWKVASKKVLGLITEGHFSTAAINPGRDRAPSDPDSERLADLLLERETALSELAGAVAAYQTLDAELQVTPAMIPVTITTEGTDPSGLILQAEGKISLARQKQARLTPRNPDYLILQDTIVAFEEEINTLRNAQRDSETIQEQRPNTEVRQPMLANLDVLKVLRDQTQAKIESLDESITKTQNIITTNSDVAERLYVAIQERDQLEESYGLLRQSLVEKRLALTALSNAYGDPYEFVQEAVAPDQPSEPKPALIIGICFFIGLLVGVGSSVAAEFSKDGYRTAADLSRAMNLPVLGVVHRISTRRERTARGLRRFVVGVASLCLLVALLGFSYAYTTRPELLPIEWVQGLDEFRASLG